MVLEGFMIIPEVSFIESLSPIASSAYCRQDVGLINEIVNVEEAFLNVELDITKLFWAEWAEEILELGSITEEE